MNTIQQMASARLLIASNRLPVSARWAGGQLRLRPSSGGLASALRPIHAERQGIWFGTTGDASLRRRSQTTLSAELSAMGFAPVFLGRADASTSYERVSNGVLWPLFHDRLDRLPLRLDGWTAYERVNTQFADAIVERWEPGDMIWVHDYHLMRLPELLRERLPSARIGFFLHIPFPNPEMFLVLPSRRDLITGLLGADVVGFHTRRYRGHFTAAVRRLLELEMDADEHLRYNGRAIRLGIYPISTDSHDLSTRATGREVTMRVISLRAENQRLLLGVDRLDYTKGLPRKLAAFEQLLETHPSYRGHVRLVQIAIPSREGVEEYQRFRLEVERYVSRINGRFGTPDWTPIQYINRSIEPEELLSLYRAADVMLVTPLRDGMNLVAKEFVASRSDEEGTLLLSEFAGAADELRDAILVNPYDVDGTAQAIHRALSLEGIERRRRMRSMRAQVLEHDVRKWATSFLNDLSNVGPTTEARALGP